MDWFARSFIQASLVWLAAGVTVGVASDEPECRKVDTWKRNRLVGVGADYIVPNFLCRPELMATLFPN